MHPTTPWIAEFIHKLAAMKPLPKEQLPDDHQISIPWRFDISMRGVENTELHKLVHLRCGNGLTQFVAMRHRPMGLQCNPLACAIAQKLRK